MDRTVVAVVMAGGRGTRLYPASRSDRPKQLLSLGGDESLLVRTLDRAAFADRRVVLTGPDHADRVRDHIRAEDAETDEVWVEPAARDTGPALVYAAGRARATYGDCVLCCLPSDHEVGGDFATVARRTVSTAVETSGLVCLGVEPDRPATGYGYVLPESEMDEAGPVVHTPVREFHEKPDRTTARELVDGGALWNAGVFAWTPEALLSAARDTPLGRLAGAVETDPETAESTYERLDPVSVDHAVMERAESVFVVPARDLEWDDLGTWDAVARVLGDAGSEGSDNTVTVGDHLAVDTVDSLLVGDGETHVTAVGVEGLVVAAYGDRVLVVPRGETERVREAVDALDETGAF